jgi:hypothetical protein
MTEQQIIELIQTGSLDAFLDCLDFAPVGVIDLLKKYSVSVPLSDYDKRQALKEKTGFDVDVALKNASNSKRIKFIIGTVSNNLKFDNPNIKDIMHFDEGTSYCQILSIIRCSR